MLRRWPGVRCCYEAGPTGFGLYRYLVEREIDCAVVAPGRVPQRPAIVSRPIRAMRASWRGCSPVGCWSRSTFRLPNWRRRAIWCVRVRTRGWIGCAIGTGFRSSVCATALSLPGKSWGVTRRRWLSEQRFAVEAEQLTFDTYLHAVDLVEARIETLERAIRETAEQEPWRELVARALPARRRHADRTWAGSRDRRLRAASAPPRS